MKIIQNIFLMNLPCHGNGHHRAFDQDLEKTHTHSRWVKIQGVSGGGGRECFAPFWLCLDEILTVC